jgi:segregation and condensation protein B
MLQRILEAILFAADGPLTIEQIAVTVPDVGADEILSTLDRMRDAYETEGRGWRLEPVAGGWQLLSHPEMYPYVERFLEGRRRARLSRAALETLAVVSYRQPITRGELEDIRGVDCGAVLHTLIERDLVRISGRAPTIGRPLFYGTTERFLEHFGLGSLSDLPRLEEIEALWASEEVRTQLEAELEKRFADVLASAGNGGNGGNGNGDSQAAEAAVESDPQEEPSVVDADSSSER